jgi:hypothetical protein
MFSPFFFIARPHAAAWAEEDVIEGGQTADDVLAPAPPA